MSRLDGDAFDAATCGYLAALAACSPLHADDNQRARQAPLVGLAVDGKILRGSRTGTASALCLLAATRHDTQTVAAQRQIAAKSNEIPAFAPLLARLIGWTNIAAATDHYRSHPADGLQLLGLTA